MDLTLLHNIYDRITSYPMRQNYDRRIRLIKSLATRLARCTIELVKDCCNRKYEVCDLNHKLGLSDYLLGLLVSL